jgi:hypothetical protein
MASSGGIGYRFVVVNRIVNVIKAQRLPFTGPFIALFYSGMMTTTMIYYPRRFE